MNPAAVPPFLMFDFPDREGKPRSLCFADPVRIVAAHHLDEVRPCLRAAQSAAQEGLYAAGYVAYEAAPAFDPALQVRSGATIPLAWFGLFRAPVPLADEEGTGTFQVSEWRPSLSPSAYDRKIAAIRAAIGRGETYQVNFTLRLHAQFAGDDFAFYRRLCAAQRAAYGAYLNLGRQRIMCASPELFFRWNETDILTRPMKGTAPRGRWPEEDAAQAEWLAHSEKNRAENLMIADLLRNDLGRIARIGTVQVAELFAIERYRTVFQMTS